jgi:hypothetical protein
MEENEGNKEEEGNKEGCLDTMVLASTSNNSPRSFCKEAESSTG